MFFQARQVMDEVDKLVDGVKLKFSTVLAYFGEEPTLQSHDFFQTLSKFIQEFVTTRDAVERIRKLEEKRKERDAAEQLKKNNAASKSDGQGGASLPAQSRRASSMAIAKVSCHLITRLDHRILTFPKQKIKQVLKENSSADDSKSSASTGGASPSGSKDDSVAVSPTAAAARQKERRKSTTSVNNS